MKIISSRHVTETEEGIVPLSNSTHEDEYSNQTTLGGKEIGTNPITTRVGTEDADIRSKSK